MQKCNANTKRKGSQVCMTSVAMAATETHTSPVLRSRYDRENI